MFLSLLELKAFKVLFLVIIIQGTLKRWIMYLLYCNYLVIIILYDITQELRQKMCEYPPAKSCCIYGTVVVLLG